MLLVDLSLKIQSMQGNEQFKEATPCQRHPCLIGDTCIRLPVPTDDLVPVAGGPS